MRTHLASRHTITALLCLGLLLISACVGNSQATSSQATGSQATPPQAQSKEFEAGVDKYMQIHRKAVGAVPDLPRETSDAALIAKHQQQLAGKIRELRPKAMVGEVFSPAVRQLVIATIKQKTEGKDGAAVKATILGDGNPKSAESPAPVNLVVNGTYPASAPLSTMPPSILMALPMLPKELEYRFVGRNLILLDSQANLIVDFIPNVL